MVAWLIPAISLATTAISAYAASKSGGESGSGIQKIERTPAPRTAEGEIMWDQFMGELFGSGDADEIFRNIAPGQSASLDVQLRQLQREANALKGRAQSGGEYGTPDVDAQTKLEAVNREIQTVKDAKSFISWNASQPGGSFSVKNQVGTTTDEDTAAHIGDITTPSGELDPKKMAWTVTDDSKIVPLEWADHNGIGHGPAKTYEQAVESTGNAQVVNSKADLLYELPQYTKAGDGELAQESPFAQLSYDDKKRQWDAETYKSLPVDKRAEFDKKNQGHLDQFYAGTITQEQLFASAESLMEEYEQFRPESKEFYPDKPEGLEDLLVTQEKFLDKKWDDFIVSTKLAQDTQVSSATEAFDTFVEGLGEFGDDIDTSFTKFEKDMDAVIDDLPDAADITSAYEDFKTGAKAATSTLNTGIGNLLTQGSVSGDFSPGAKGAPTLAEIAGLYDTFKEDIGTVQEDIRNIPGTKVSFGGQSLGTMLPKRELLRQEMLGGLVKDSYTKGSDNVTQQLDTIESLSDILFKKFDKSTGSTESIFTNYLDSVDSGRNLATTESNLLGDRFQGTLDKVTAKKPLLTGELESDLTLTDLIASNATNLAGKEWQGAAERPIYDAYLKFYTELRDLAKFTEGLRYSVPSSTETGSLNLPGPSFMDSLGSGLKTSSSIIELWSKIKPLMAGQNDPNANSAVARGG